jgi:hypothetical protein
MKNGIWIAALLFVSACASGEQDVPSSIDLLTDEGGDLSIGEGFSVSASSLSKGAGGVVGDFDYCRESACVSGEGDCDRNAECVAGSTCVANVGLRFGMPAKWDYCLEPRCLNGVRDPGETSPDCGGACGECACSGLSGDSTFCDSACPCGAGDADCDRNTDCAPGLVCGRGKGRSFGYSSSIDVCVAPHCTDHAQNADEIDVDCGGADCGVCAGAHCSNHVRDRDEQGIDCGGAECPACVLMCSDSDFPRGGYWTVVHRRVCTYPNDRSCRLSCVDREPTPIYFELVGSSYELVVLIPWPWDPYMSFGEPDRVTQTASGLHLEYDSDSSWMDFPSLCPFTGWLDQKIPDFRIRLNIELASGLVTLTEACEDYEGYCAHFGYQYGSAAGDGYFAGCF